MESLLPNERPSCFGTGIEMSGHVQRPAVCDRCSHLRGCVARIMLHNVRRTAPDPMAWDAFISPDLVRRRG
jgi:hypothetical protein